MNDGKTLFALILGAAVGSLITWKVVTDKYERIISDIYAEQEEEEEQAEPVDGDTDNRESTRAEIEADERLNARIQYEEAVLQSGYAAAFTNAVAVKDETTDENEEEGDEDMAELGPRFVSPEEFDDCEYPVVEFTYYSDGFLTDEDDEIVNDIAGTVGKDFADHFGEYDEDPDVVYVIDDSCEVCYEICRDNRKYMNVRAARFDSTED